VGTDVVAGAVVVGAGVTGTVGTAAGAVTAGAGAGAASAFAGIFNFLPTFMLVVVKLFSVSMALTLTPYFLAILCNVSPDFTV
jgi:hypothetical protein